jgi:curved DNA-binding protein CbpA
MAAKEALLLYLSSLDKKTYYDILGSVQDASPAAIKAGFHSFSLLYHPDRFVDSSKEIGELASEIYKRGVEAYRCLSRRDTRARYDRSLARGKIRLDAWLPSTPPPMAPVRTLETIARTLPAKKFAGKADRLLSVGRLDDARLELVGACQCEPDNEELAERLRFLYEALALESGS